MTMQNTTKQSFAQRWNDYQPTKSILLWACAVTAIATMIIGFNWGGWVTGGTSQTMAATAGNVARGALASDICVEKFKAGPDAAARLVEFKAITDSYKKRQFVETGGWATMPGQTTRRSARRRSLRRRARCLSFFGDNVTCAAEIFSRRTFPISRARSTTDDHVPKEGRPAAACGGRVRAKPLRPHSQTRRGKASEIGHRWHAASRPTDGRG